MELYFALQGLKEHQDRFIKSLESQFFPFEGKALRDGVKVLGKTYKKGEKIKINIQGRLCPLRFYKYVFPKESLDVVLNSVGLPKNPENYLMKKLSRYIGWIRKLLGLKPIPETKDKRKLLMSNEHIGIIGLGIKEDKIGEVGDSGVYQEWI